MKYFSITFFTDLETFISTEELLYNEATCLSAFNHAESLIEWEIELIAQEQQLPILKNILRHYVDKIKKLKITGIDGKINWLEETYKAFSPINIGTFCIYGSHMEKKPTQNIHALCLDAATAFGSGEHATTQGCILGMEQLMEKGCSPQSVLDLGCGSGILALAANTLWPKSTVWASDSDEEAVCVAERYAKINNCKIQIFLSKSFEAIPFKDKSFDLIIANILANTLIMLAPAISKHTNPKGHIILSGILIDQADSVHKAYEKEGFYLIEKQILGGWVTLTLADLKDQTRAYPHN